MSKYGMCPDCDAELEPEWFVDEEYQTTRDGYMFKTGRTRLAVDYLVCPSCLSRHCVDDSFDRPWR